jgi:carboxyl-terminal processing protease
VARSTRRLFDRMLKEDRLARLSSCLNTVSQAYDPHTEHFKPEAKEEFDLSMTGTPKPGDLQVIIVTIII